MHLLLLAPFYSQRVASKAGWEILGHVIKHKHTSSFPLLSFNGSGHIKDKLQKQTIPYSFALETGRGLYWDAQEGAD
jgi:hypothetical protein